MKRETYETLDLLRLFLECTGWVATICAAAISIAFNANTRRLNEKTAALVEMQQAALRTEEQPAVNEDYFDDAPALRIYQ